MGRTRKKRKLLQLEGWLYPDFKGRVEDAFHAARFRTLLKKRIKSGDFDDLMVAAADKLIRKELKNLAG